MRTTPLPREYNEVFDTVIVGTGLAGLAAIRAQCAAGKRALLLDHRGRGDLLDECSRAFATELGPASSPVWDAWLAELRQAGAAKTGLLDGALAEIVATHWLREQRVPVLYYTIPVAAERDAGGLLSSLIVASKSGYFRIAGRQWIDATGEGLLARLLGQPATVDSVSFRAAIYLQGGDWDLGAWRAAGEDGAALSLHDGLWPEEHVLRVEWQDDSRDWWQRVEPALRALHAASPVIAKSAVVSHLSAEPLRTGRLHLAGAMPANVRTVGADSALKSLADRFAAGTAEAMALSSAPAAEAAKLSAPLPALSAAATLETEVLVTGAGTGGALAAIAAARQQVQTLCVEPLAFPGGIGAGGGIHIYYFGFPGGLQYELDERVRAAMPLFAGSRKQVPGFHPDAKKLVLQTMLREAGVTVFYGTTLVAASVREGRVDSATVASPGGLRTIRAHSFIDGTGDGDLAAKAGAVCHLGRIGDGNLHAYSQSSGRLHTADGKLAMAVVNFDAGWVDPTDIADLTRARLTGIDQYWAATFDPAWRATYIAPAIGLRQGRQVETDYVLTLADLVEHRQFQDAIGRTGAHYDNHAVDFAFESDEAIFWVWGCQSWQQRTHCELPYRIMLPRGLANLWVACRAAGVSADAHHSMRMQRDFQRLGEVAGLAAALAVRHDCGSRDIPWPELAEALARSGALSVQQMTDRHQFGVVQSLAEIPALTPATVSAEQIAEGMAGVRQGLPGPALWHVYRAPDLPAELTELLSSPDDHVSWCAAIVLAMRGEVQAEPRLRRAVEQLEDCREHVAEPRRQPPNWQAPRWLTALALLRCCGTPASVPAIRRIVTQPSPSFHLLSTAMTTTERLAKTLGGDAVRSLIEELLALDPADYMLKPQYRPNLQREAPPAERTVESHAWQVAMMQARLAVLVGRSPEPWRQAGLADSRALVRRQFAAIGG